MALSERHAGKRPRSLFQRTLLYMLGFGLGSLLLVVVVGYGLASMADALLPGKSSAAKKLGSSSRRDSKKSGAAAKKPASKARSPRANQPSKTQEKL